MCDIEQVHYQGLFLRRKTAQAARHVACRSVMTVAEACSKDKYHVREPI